MCRFRQLYREERSSQSSDDVLNVNLSSTDEEQPLARRRISKVVVAHNENLETFYDFQESFASPEKGGASFNDVFFDNDSFWSGSITWYWHIIETLIVLYALCFVLLNNCFVYNPCIVSDPWVRETRASNAYAVVSHKLQEYQRFSC